MAWRRSGGLGGCTALDEESCALEDEKNVQIKIILLPEETKNMTNMHKK